MDHNLPSYQELARDIAVLLGKRILISFSFGFSETDTKDNFVEEAFIINHVHHNKNEKSIKLVFVCDGVEADVAYYTVGVHIEESTGVTVYFSEIDGPDLFLEEKNTTVSLS